MCMYNLIEYSAASNAIGLDKIGNIIDFPDENNNSTSLKFKQKTTGQTGNGGTKDGSIKISKKFLEKI